MRSGWSHTRTSYTAILKNNKKWDCSLNRTAAVTQYQSTAGAIALPHLFGPNISEQKIDFNRSWHQR